MAAILLALATLIVGNLFVILNQINANETLRLIFQELRSIGEVIDDHAIGWPLDAAPDMIALLGDAYAPKPFTGSRDMIGEELAELMDSKGVYAGDLSPEGVLGAGRHDPLGR